MNDGILAHIILSEDPENWNQLEVIDLMDKSGTITKRVPPQWGFEAVGMSHDASMDLLIVVEAGPLK